MLAETSGSTSNCNLEFEIFLGGAQISEQGIAGRCVTGQTPFTENFERFDEFSVRKKFSICSDKAFRENACVEAVR